jgi:hypothetical protein
VREALFRPIATRKEVAAYAGLTPLYRPRFLRHRIEAYAARAADGSWLCRTAFGV